MTLFNPDTFQILRLILLAVGSFLCLLSLQKGGPFPRSCFWIFLAFWLETGLFFLLKRRFSRRKILWGQLLGDLILTTFLIYFTGQRESPFLFLYPLLIFIAGFHLGRKAADLFTLFTLVLYAFTFWAIPSRPSLDPAAILQFSVPLCAMGLSGLLALRFAEEIRRSQKKIKETHEALFRAEELHRHILQSLASGLIITDLDLKIISTNQAACEILFEEELRGRDLTQILPQLDLDVLQKRKRAEFSFEKGGRRRYIGYSFFPLREENGKIFGYGFIFQDITEIKEQERQLRRAEHLAALGTMASGLVHEIKNPLASICGAVEFLKEGGLVLPEGERLLAIISREAQRLDKLVTDFLLFARPKKGEVERVFLTKLLQQIEEELSLREGKRFSLRISLPQGLYFWGEEAQLKQVFLNLFLNSLEAKPEGRVELEVSYTRNDDQVFLLVKDNAGGIPPEIRERIFEPFFTTKPQGTGLGLAVVYSLVKNWEGDISCEVSNGGTLFRLTFPASRFG